MKAGDITDRKYFDAPPAVLRITPFGIFVDQAGYYPRDTKKAVIPFECESFTVTDMIGNVRYSGKTVYAGADEASGDNVRIADFSELTEKGSYCVRAGGRTSAMFRIGDDIYDDVFMKTSKAFYYLRCGCGLDERHAGVWHHGKCHTAPAKLWEDRNVTLDVSGGWHDAGDYGRYVTAGACAVSHLLYAFRLFPEAFEKQKLNIPEEGLPDILSEVRCELEWFLKMQNGEGGVYHKATTALHAPFVMPEDDTAEMFVFPVSSMATADLAAVCALASGVYSAYDKTFSDRLLKAAEKSVEWLERNPQFIGFTNPEGCNTGGYGERDDLSNRFWAYSEMYALTGERKYHDRLVSALEKDFPLTALGYGEVGGVGALAYILCEREKDTALLDRLKKEFLSLAEELKKKADKCGYGIAMESSDYYWGSNMGLMTKAMIFAVTDVLYGDHSCREYACRHIHCLLGANALGISYVTGAGEFRCNYPHLRPAFADGIEECIPGMVAGGPNKYLSDPFAANVIPKGTPPMKCYADDTASYSLNEITIYWNSPTVFVLAYLCTYNRP
ncbi:MAG: glycoside hydrolase family 9 protein [Ruminococcus sp.]|nr:glycoside hydrolase family 9 protein [Ruminococcus sp.]